MIAKDTFASYCSASSRTEIIPMVLCGAACQAAAVNRPRLECAPEQRRLATGAQDIIPDIILPHIPCMSWITSRTHLAECARDDEPYPRWSQLRVQDNRCDLHLQRAPARASKTKKPAQQSHRAKLCAGLTNMVRLFGAEP